MLEAAMCDLRLSTRFSAVKKSRPGMTSACDRQWKGGVVLR
jgi:hypothetical protein